MVIGDLQSYMAGEFSLADAVRELREARNQVRVRDRQITELTALINSLQININDLIEENGDLRLEYIYCYSWVRIYLLLH